MIPAGRITDQDVRIRAARNDDLSALVELDTAVFGRLAYQYFMVRQLFDLHGEWWLVAEHPEGLRGYSLGVPTFDRRHAWLMGLGVRREFQRRGYGRSLTVGSMLLLADAGVREVSLTVEPANYRAIALYSELGFERERLARDYLGPGEHRLIMTAALRMP